LFSFYLSLTNLLSAVGSDLKAPQQQQQQAAQTADHEKRDEPRGPDCDSLWNGYTVLPAADKPQQNGFAAHQDPQHNENCQQRV
jgi:hypothetical protein